MRQGIAASGKREKIFLTGLGINKRRRRDEKHRQTQRASLAARCVVFFRRRVLTSASMMHLLYLHVRAAIRFRARDRLGAQRRDQHGQRRA